MSVIDRTGWKENVQDLINLIQLLVAISVKALRNILDQNTVKNFLKLQICILFQGLVITNYTRKHLISMIQWAQILHESD